LWPNDVCCDVFTSHNQIQIFVVQVTAHVDQISNHTFNFICKLNAVVEMVSIMQCIFTQTSQISNKRLFFSIFLHLVLHRFFICNDIFYFFFFFTFLMSHNNSKLFSFAPNTFKLPPAYSFSSGSCRLSRKLYLLIHS